MALTGCWGTRKLDLMATPLVHQQLGEGAYSGVATESCSPVTDLIYATNRPPAHDEEAGHYGNGSAGRLALGVVKVRRGDDSMSWEELKRETSLPVRSKEIPLSIESTFEIEVGDVSPSAGLSAAVNRSLRDSPDDELTIFVPGAQSSFYKSCAHATHLRHFLLGQGAIVTFSWPSTGLFVGYPQDTRFARDSVRHLADLIERLADTTEASRINIFSYSAGAQVTAPALASLRDRQPEASADELRQRYRLGKVYLAAPDVSSEAFYTEYLPAFRDYVDRTTFTYHRKDPFLKASHRLTGVARLGRPAGLGRAREVTWLKEAASHPAVEAIDLEHSPAERAVDFSSHGAWYSNSWVSSDLVVLLRSDRSARERGLLEKPDGTGWYFPCDYPDRLGELPKLMGMN